MYVRMLVELQKTTKTHCEQSCDLIPISRSGKFLAYNVTELRNIYQYVWWFFLYRNCDGLLASYIPENPIFAFNVKAFENQKIQIKIQHLPKFEVIVTWKCVK